MCNYTLKRNSLKCKTGGPSAQLELDLNVSALSEAANYHDSERFGFFAILTRDASGKTSQKSYTLDKLPFILDQNGQLSRLFVGCKHDVYVSQASFETPSRRVVNLKEIKLAYLDVDCYKFAWGQHQSPEEIAAYFNFLCDFENVPRASEIVFQGAGCRRSGSSRNRFRARHCLGGTPWSGLWLRKWSRTALILRRGMRLVYCAS